MLVNINDTYIDVKEVAAVFRGMHDDDVYVYLKGNRDMVDLGDKYSVHQVVEIIHAAMKNEQFNIKMEEEINK